MGHSHHCCAQDVAIHLMLEQGNSGSGLAVPHPSPGANIAPLGAVASPAAVGADLCAKYIAAENQIRLGKAQDATHGLQVLLGLSDTALGQILLDPVAAIRHEFEQQGGIDQFNFEQIIGGTFGDGKTLGELMTHEHSQLAKLKVHHVLALRLYTSSSYARVNDPLRTDPPTRPHPFAATAHFITEGIKMLRAVAASLPDAHETRIYWRGMRDIGLTMEFMQKGGTEFGCLSTSASKDVATNFAASALPLIFKFETKDFTSRGADISFLSVYPAEKEALYPPLTYLRAVKTEKETLGSIDMLVATVEPVFM